MESTKNHDNNNKKNRPKGKAACPLSYHVDGQQEGRTLARVDFS